MGNVRHGWAQNEGSQFIAFKILNTGGTMTIDQVSGPQMFTADVAITDNGIGRYAIAIVPLRGSVGAAIVNVTSVNTAATLSTGPSYSGDTLSFAIAVNSATTYTDADVYVQVAVF